MMKGILFVVNSLPIRIRDKKKKKKVRHNLLPLEFLESFLIFKNLLGFMSLQVKTEMDT